MPNNLAPLSDIKSKIYTIRNQQVMLDSDLAELYQVETKVFNQAVKRNIARFPNRFRFQLSDEENEIVLRSQFVTSSLMSQKTTPSQHGGRRYLPFVFTEQGVSMLSAVLRSDIAIEVSIKIIDTFVEMKRVISSNELLFQRFERIEQKLSVHDDNFNQVFKALENRQETQKQMIFYNGELFDAYQFIADIIRSAKQSIVLVDNYIDDNTLTLFTKNQNVDVLIYTHTISKQLKLDLEKYNAQYRPLEIKNFKNSHDRFLIIDSTVVYNIGASLKDLGNKMFAINKMDSFTLEDIIR